MEGVVVGGVVARGLGDRGRQRVTGWEVRRAAPLSRSGKAKCPAAAASLPAGTPSAPPHATPHLT